MISYPSYFCVFVLLDWLLHLVGSSRFTLQFHAQERILFFPLSLKKCHLERFAPSSQVAEGCTLPLRSVAAGSDPYCNCVGAGSIGKVWWAKIQAHRAQLFCLTHRLAGTLLHPVRVWSCSWVSLCSPCPQTDPWSFYPPSIRIVWSTNHNQPIENLTLFRNCMKGERKKGIDCLCRYDLLLCIRSLRTRLPSCLFCCGVNTSWWWQTSRREARLLHASWGFCTCLN